MTAQTPVLVTHHPHVPLLCFFNVTVYGATSGANIEVRESAGWLSSQSFKDANGRWRLEVYLTTLCQTEGAYRAYNP